MNRTKTVLLALLGACLLTVLSAGPASASSRAQAERALAQAQALLGGRSNAAAPAGTAAGGVSAHEATPVLLTLSRNLDALPPAERRQARKLLRRPSDSSDHDSFGNEASASPLCDAHFCVHWGTAAAAAPPGRDANSNGIPDYVEEVLAAGDRSFAVENTQLGWRVAPSDGTKGARKGRGGDGQTDVYITGLGRGLYGYSTTDAGASGRREAGYLVVDNDYSTFRGTPVKLMQVTFAHEYNHILQFGYDSFQDLWMFESTATYMENNVYPDIDDYLHYVPAVAKNPFTPLAEVPRHAFKLYGEAVWNHYLASRWGDAVVRNAWAVSDSVSPADFAVSAYDRAIRERRRRGLLAGLHRLRGGHGGVGLDE